MVLWVGLLQCNQLYWNSHVSSVETVRGRLHNSVFGPLWGTSQKRSCSASVIYYFKRLRCMIPLVIYVLLETVRGSLHNSVFGPLWGTSQKRSCSASIIHDFKGLWCMIPLVIYVLLETVRGSLHNSVFGPLWGTSLKRVVFCVNHSLFLTPSLTQPVKFPVWMMHGHNCKQSIIRSYNTSTFNHKHFDENPFTCQCEKKTKSLKGFKFRTFIGRFQVTSRQWRG